MSGAANFDAIARAYRWLEYLSFGPALSLARLQFLSQLTGSRCGLLMGDGDGRFLARLVEKNRDIVVDAVDSSPKMLALAQRRALNADPDAMNRVRFYQADALSFQPPRSGYDLVATHFFLDCFCDRELEALVSRILPSLAPGCLWVVSDFRVPESGAMSLPASWIVGLLYRAFGVMTGLRTRRLPDYPRIFSELGMMRVDRTLRLRGLLVSELWRLPSRTADGESNRS